VIPTPPLLDNLMKKSLTWTSPDISIDKSRLVSGQRGVFATASIAEGTALMVMGGAIIDIETHNRIGEFAENYGMDISEEHSFCPKDEEELEQMPQCIINHSCDPNAGFRDRLHIVAIKDIEAGDEIAYDYGFLLFCNPDNHFEFAIECTCRNPRCRQTITVHDWKLPELQQKYGKWFQPFLREKFAKS
jgi:SET domain-containing protein